MVMSAFVDQLVPLKTLDKMMGFSVHLHLFYNL